MRRVWLLALALALSPLVVLSAGQPSPARRDVGAVLARVGAAIERYYARARSVVCTETVTIQPLGYDLLSDGNPARRLVFELRVAWDSAAEGMAPDARVERQLVRVNNRAPRPSDKPACTDPTPVAPDGLAMLLPAKQGEYTFSVAGDARVNGRTAVMLDYRARQVGPVKVGAPEGREDCFVLDMPGRTKGRLWIDTETDEILRLDEWLVKFVDARVPATKKMRTPLDVTVERLDSTTSYRPVTFTDPDEVIMMPSSAESLTVIRNSGIPRQRVSQRFTNYQRFTTGGRIVDNQ